MANKAEKKARVKEQQRHAKVLWNWILGFKVKKLEKEFERIGCAIFEVDLCPPRQRTCLHIAALEGFEIGVRRFIDWKAEVDARDIDGHTPLFEALKSCHLNTAKILIDNRASINARDKQNNTPLVCNHAMLLVDADNHTSTNARITAVGLSRPKFRPSRVRSLSH